MKSVVIIDDDATNNYLNELLIRLISPDMLITSFTDPLQALKHLAVLKDELEVVLLLDLNMPEMSGWEFIERLPAGRKFHSVYILTSSILPVDKEIAQKYGAITGFVHKPLTTETMSRILT